VHPVIRLVQRRLTEAGFRVPESGRYDAATEDALQRFQRFVGLDPTGVLDDTTARRLWRMTRRTSQ